MHGSQPRLFMETFLDGEQRSRISLGRQNAHGGSREGTCHAFTLIMGVSPTSWLRGTSLGPGEGSEMNLSVGI